MKNNNIATLRFASGATLAGCIALAAACTTSAGGLDANGSPALRSGHNARALYVFESDASGFNTKTVFFDNGEEVVAIDAQFTPELARKSLEFLRTKTANPVTHLVITHPNPDKFNGASVFKDEGAEIIASKLTAESIEGVHAYKKHFFVNVAKMFTEESYPVPVSVDRSFDRRLDLRLKDGTLLELSESGLPGVSTNQTVVSIPAAKALVVGDLVHEGAHAWLEGGIVDGAARPTIASWIQNLEELAKDFPADTIVYGGRGSEGLSSQVLPRQIAYLEKADALVGQYVASLRGAQMDFAALTQKFETAFPSHKLSYMIQYGAYGLANAKLSH
jgi:glyoxylase-like metal-dependent hydrolase (beta-lactamase superfamily II)